MHFPAVPTLLLLLSVNPMPENMLSATIFPTYILTALIGYLNSITYACRSLALSDYGFFAKPPPFLIEPHYPSNTVSSYTVIKMTYLTLSKNGSFSHEQNNVSESRYYRMCNYHRHADHHARPEKAGIFIAADR